MGHAKGTERTRAEELWDEYQAIQLTPEQKAAARRRMEERVEQARQDGTYERVLEIAGTVKWSLSWQKLRGKE
jgi:hypothetical protein